MQERDINVTETPRVYWRGRRTHPQQHGPGATPRRAWQRAGRPRQQASLLGEEGGYHLQGKLTSAWLSSYQGNQQLGQIPQSPQIYDHHKG